MKQLLAVVVVAACAGTTTGAQRGSIDERPTGQSDEAKEITVIGCLERVMAGATPSYRLTEVGIGRGEGRAATAQGAGVPAAHGQPPVDLGAAQQQGISQGEYLMSVASKAEVDLAEHVGSRIEVTGTLHDTLGTAARANDSKSAPSSTSSSSTSEDTSASGRAARETNQMPQTIVVTQAKEIATTCR
jgi:hypothetical protein